MTVRIVILCSALLCTLSTSLVSPTSAEIFKCVGDGVTAYQSMPCAPGTAETRMSPAGGPPPCSDIPMPAIAAAPAHEPLRRAGPWNHTTLTLGMSDDEVLNMPGWGRPTRIMRVRVPHEWREEWVYGATADGERHLHFANAKLVDISYTFPADQLVQLSRR